MIPEDPVILLSFVNTKLRDAYADLDDLCAALDIDAAELSAILERLEYRYDPAQNQFISTF